MAVIVDSYPLLLTQPPPLRAVRRYFLTVHRYTSRLLILDFGAILTMISVNVKAPSPPLLPPFPSLFRPSSLLAAATALAAPLAL
jgi:hypothetical protein